MALFKILYPRRVDSFAGTLGRLVQLKTFALLLISCIAVFFSQMQLFIILSGTGLEQFKDVWVVRHVLLTREIENSIRIRFCFSYFCKSLLIDIMSYHHRVSSLVLEIDICTALNQGRYHEGCSQEHCQMQCRISVLCITKSTKMKIKNQAEIAETWYVLKTVGKSQSCTGSYPKSCINI